MADPYTIKIFVPDGNPDSVRIIDRMNWTGLGLVIPRDKWNETKNREELKRPGIYILHGYKPDDEDKPTIYVGQGDGIRVRIDSHFQNKEFWDTAVAFVSSSLSGGLNRAHITWLEYALVNQASLVNRCYLDNGNVPQEPALAEADKAELQVFLREIFQILPLIGIRAFEYAGSINIAATKIDSKNTKDTSKEYMGDTVVVPARIDGFEEVFLAENHWYAIRISKGRIHKIRFIAAYVVNPVSAITHYAEVKEIRPYGDSGKYELIFSEPAKKIGPIKGGRHPGGGVQGPFYTTFDKLKSAKIISDLYQDK